MTRQNTEFTIDNGPSKLDLMLSLFDTDMGARMVEFHTRERIVKKDIKVHIHSARRRNPAANIWEIEGFIRDPNVEGGKDVRVSIYYLSDTREGIMRFEEELRTHGIMETPNDSKRARALMTIIHKIIVTYQNSHRGNLDEEIFRLFEKAKMVSFAEDHNSLVEAIKKI